ncbi:MAG TPA: UDP-N-acetylglucosamine 2-epimerase (non-hydrolyzing) [Deltaproteobacteria bacterium]|nr:UDP-N-acetylglucosamine 2-epimerase (non-hydrolyzing) [Deltaproteobacteria bacterium]HCP45241.1 UDP-N-acetylglucosamine 2-epimerase (non-hydrolyzing) [Deltaproteobacteria bacterium]
MRVLSVFGTRPEAIKMAPVLRALDARSDLFESLVCVTGQHREMLDQVLNAFQLRPDVDLHLMTEGQDFPDLAAAALKELARLIPSMRPDLVLVHGDTTTTLAAAMAAAYAEVPVAHVEAGLRTGNLRSPFPEEMNRRLADRLCSYHFAPTETARANLLEEGISSSSIRVTGNTAIDALLWMHDMVTDRPEPILRRFAERGLSLESGRPRVLITAHRRESLQGGLDSICRAVRTLSTRHSHVDWIYPVHLNPHVRQRVLRILGKCPRPNLHLLPPLPYPEFVFLMDRCRFVVTDSGGLQEEGPSLGKPVLVLREVTERPEGVAAGVLKIVGTGEDTIVRWATRLLNDDEMFQAMSSGKSPFGDGKAAHRIVEALAQEARKGAATA